MCVYLCVLKGVCVTSYTLPSTPPSQMSHPSRHQTHGKSLQLRIGSYRPAGHLDHGQPDDPPPCPPERGFPPTSVQEEGDLIDFGTPVDPAPGADQGFVVKRVFAGGDQSFMSMVVTELGVEVSN